MKEVYKWLVSFERWDQISLSQNFFLPTEEDNIVFHMRGHVSVSSSSYEYNRKKRSSQFIITVHKGCTKAVHVEIAVAVQNMSVSHRKRLCVWEDEITFPKELLPYEEVQPPVSVTVNCEIIWHGFANLFQMNLNCSKYFMNSELSDFVIEVEGTDYPVHKVILASQSEIFRKIFTTDMKEMSENRMIISDLSPQIVEKLLKYLYSGSANDLAEDYDLSKELLAVADKYDISGLKKMCSWALMKHLSLKNVFEMLDIANIYHTDELYAYIMSFMIENQVKVKNLSEFDEFMKAKPHHMIPFLHQMIDYNNEK